VKNNLFRDVIHLYGHECGTFAKLAGFDSEGSLCQHE
jgi:hypothetical protein